MSRAARAAMLVALLGLGAAAAEETHTARLAVSNMSCPLCPITVRKALEKAPGVKKASVDYAAGTATVTYDPRQADERSLVRATTSAGFPSTVLP